jgi:glycerophosphoryl diester phosphodiesterase
MKPKYNSNSIIKIAVTLFLALSLVISVRYLLSQEWMINRIELFLVQLQFGNKSLTEQVDTNFKFSPFIAHAGGGIDGLEYTNSLEALNQSYDKGFRLIEVDLFLTSDNQIVLLHDAANTIDSLYLDFPKELTLENFKKLKLKNNLTPLSFQDLIVFMGQHQDLFIITDYKDQDNIKILTTIIKEYPEYKDRIIPQIFKFNQYYPTLKLGYTKIIFSLYQTNYSKNLLQDFLSDHRINILTIPKELISQKIIDDFKKYNLKIYTHPVNQAEERNQLFESEVDGIYTSSLLPK